MKLIHNSAILLGLALTALPACADQIISAGTGLAAPDITLTFSEISLAAGTALTNQFSAYGVTFAGAYYDPQAIFFATPSIGNYNLTGGSVNNPVSILFTNTITDIAFQFITNIAPPNSTFAVYLGGNPVDSFTAFTSFSQDWYGFTNLSFDEIRVSGGGADGVFLLDNLQFSSNVPEPAALPLAGATLAALLIFRHRRAHAAVRTR